MADTLDQDLEALKEWLGKAWRQLAQPSMTRFDRRELRNYMRQAETALQIASKKAAERDNRRRELFNAPNGLRPTPNLRLLNILAGSSRADGCCADPKSPPSDNFIPLNQDGSIPVLEAELSLPEVPAR